MNRVRSDIASYLAYRPQVRLDDLQEIRQLVEHELATAGQEDRQSSRTSA